jgi:hypothetical protein
VTSQPFVRITLERVYDEVRSTHDAVQSLVSSLEPIKDTVADHEARLRLLDALPEAVEDVETAIEGLQTRMRTVEWRQGMWAGGAAVFAGSAGSLITWALTRH